MNITEEKFLEKLDLLLNKEELNEIESDVYEKLIGMLNNLGDEDFNKVKTLVDVLTNNDKSKAVELAKKSTESYINSIENNSINYITDVQQIEAYLNVINDQNLINRYKNMDVFLAKELLIDLNNVILEVSK